jgi:hypothetical protein
MPPSGLHRPHNLRQQVELTCRFDFTETSRQVDKFPRQMPCMKTRAFDHCDTALAAAAAAAAEWHRQPLRHCERSWMRHGSRKSSCCAAASERSGWVRRRFLRQFHTKHERRSFFAKTGSGQARVEKLKQVSLYRGGYAKRNLLRHLCIKTNILPRQARDKHRENSKKSGVFRRHGSKGRCDVDDGEHPR